MKALMKLVNITVLNVLTLGLFACGGSDSESNNGSDNITQPTPPPVVASPSPTPFTPSLPNGNEPSSLDNTQPSPLPTPKTTPTAIVAPLSVEISALIDTAVEQSNQLAKFIITRQGHENELTISYQLISHPDVTKGTASKDDFTLLYSDGGQVGDSFYLAAGQNSRVIEVHPIKDNQHEVPERLTIALTPADNLLIGEKNSAFVTLIDATNVAENNKVFLGNFTAQGNAVTFASGSLSLLVQGDNESAVLNYKFNNLGSEQTDQHIHLSPSGTMIKDIEKLGAVSNYQWDLAPGGIFKTEQEMLDALFNGEFFLNIHTANYPHGEISASFNFDASYEPPAEILLTPQDIDRDIIRFLTQATFGATPSDYQTIKQQLNESGDNRLDVYRQWIEQQLALPQTSLLDFSDETAKLFPSENAIHNRRDAFWPLAVYGKDQLRQRMALALSEILVIGDNSGPLYNAERGVAHYWDQLAANSSGTYLQALTDATLSPVMGVWLSHLKNQKEDTEKGYFPDENYAREIMQLFTIGLVKRQRNGKIILGDDNLPIPTYDNDVIKQMAKVFTGLSFSYYYDGNGKAENTNFKRGNQSLDKQYRWLEPMTFFTDYHEFGAKSLFSDRGLTLAIPATGSESVQTARNELDTVLSALVAHSSTAPFISKQLIQRFVTSNPSPEYIERVANAFGPTGDLTAVIQAILLDKEARNPAVSSSTTFGKVKEPILQFTNILRLFNSRSQLALGEQTNGIKHSMATQFHPQATLLRIGKVDVAQRALSSPSVFNFFLPDYSPTGDLALNSLVSPELQLATESQVFTTINVYDRLLRRGMYQYRSDEHSTFTQEQLKVWLDDSELRQLWESTQGTEQEKAEAVLNFIDFYLAAGSLSRENKISLRQVFIDNYVEAGVDELLDLSVYGAVTVPEFMVQR